MFVISCVVSGSVCVGVPFQCGYGGVVSLCSLKHCVYLSFCLHGATRLPLDGFPLNLIFEVLSPKNVVKIHV